MKYIFECLRVDQKIRFLVDTDRGSLYQRNIFVGKKANDNGPYNKKLEGRRSVLLIFWNSSL